MSSTCTMIIPMRCPEQSRRQKKAGSSLRNFHESPWRVTRSSFHHPRRESGNPKTPCTISIKAPFSIPGKPREGGSKNKGSSTSRGFPRRKALDTSTPLRLRHHPIDDTILKAYAHRCPVRCRCIGSHQTMSIVRTMLTLNDQSRFRFHGQGIPGGVQQTIVFNFDVQILNANVFLWGLADESLRPRPVNEF